MSLYVYISAASIGEFLLSKQQRPEQDDLVMILVVGWCTFILALAACYFAYVLHTSRAEATMIHPNLTRVSWISIGIFGFSVMTSRGLLALNEKGK